MDAKLEPANRDDVAKVSVKHVRVKKIWLLTEDHGTFPQRTVQSVNVHFSEARVKLWLPE